MIETKRELRTELKEAEWRAKRHFEKLQEIEKIIKVADEKHEMAIFTLKDIKNALAMVND